MITDYKVDQLFTSNLSVEEREKNSSCTSKHVAGRELSTMLKRFLIRRSQECQWKENHTVAALWKPIRSGLDRFLPGSLQGNPFSIIRVKALKPTNRALDPSLKDFARQGLISMNLSQSTSVQFPAKKLKFSIQQISLGWTLCMVLNQSTSEREAVKTNARWNPLTFGSKQQQAGWGTSS